MSPTVTDSRRERPTAMAAAQAPGRATRLAPPGRRGHAISAFFVACYAGLIIPVVGVGVLSGFTGTFPAVLAFSVLLAALCLFSLAKITTTLAPETAASR